MENQSPFTNIPNALASFIPSRTYDYTKAPTPAPAVDASKLGNAIAYNETRGVQNPYSFTKYSGDPTIGNANGKYQVTDAELKTYSPKFLGTTTSPQTFLQSPALQDRYIQAKINSLSSRGLTPAQILAVHRGGMSDLTPGGLASVTKAYQPYISAGMSQYNSTSTPQAASLSTIQ